MSAALWRVSARRALGHLRVAQRLAPEGYRADVAALVATLKVMTQGVEAPLGLDDAEWAEIEPAPEEAPAEGSRWEYRYQDGRTDRFGVAGVIDWVSRDNPSVLTTIGGMPAGSIALCTWRRWVADGRLVELRGAP